MGDLSFLNRNKTNQTQQGVFNLYSNTQKTKSADRAKTKRAFTTPATRPQASLPNFTSQPAASGSFFTSRKLPSKKPRKAKLTKPDSGAKIGPVFSIGPVVPRTKTASIPTPTRQAAASIARPERPTAVRMNRIRTYDF